MPGIHPGGRRVEGKQPHGSKTYRYWPAPPQDRFHPSLLSQQATPTPTPAPLQSAFRASFLNISGQARSTRRMKRKALTQRESNLRDRKGHKGNRKVQALEKNCKTNQVRLFREMKGEFHPWNKNKRLQKVNPLADRSFAYYKYNS